MSRILHHVDRKDFKKTRQRQIGEQKECDAQKLKEWQEAEATRPYKSNWRKEINLQESDWTPVAGSIANATAQTFSYSIPNFQTDQPNTVTVSGLGGVESVPSTVTVDFGFGETEVVSAPDYSQLGMQGYAPPLGGVQRQTKQTENERIDAEIIKLEEQIKQLGQKRSDLENEQFETEPQYTGMSHSDYIDKTNEINDKWNKKTGPLGEIIYGSSSDSEKKAAYAKLDVYERARIKELEALNAQYNKSNEAYAKAQNDHFAAYTAKVDSALAKQEVLRVKIAELEKQRPINQQLDAAQQAYSNLPFMGARVQGVPQQPSFNYDPSKMGKEIAQIASSKGVVGLTQQDQEWLNGKQSLVNKLKIAQKFGGPAIDFAQWAINWAKGDYTPIKEFSPQMRDDVLYQITRTLKNRSGTSGAVQYHDYELLTNKSTKLGLGRFNFNVGPNGVKVKDNFDVDLGGDTIGGLLRMIPGLQDDATRITEIGNRVGGGKKKIPIDITIPWSEISPQLQNRLDPTATIIPTVKRKNEFVSGRVSESTWDKLKKHR
jgi:hypothetical protein